MEPDEPQRHGGCGGLQGQHAQEAAERCHRSVEQHVELHESAQTDEEHGGKALAERKHQGIELATQPVAAQHNSRRQSSQGGWQSY